MLQIRVESVLSMYCILENLSSDPVGTGGCAYDPVGTGGCAYAPVGTGGCAYDLVGTDGCAYALSEQAVVYASVASGSRD